MKLRHERVGTGKRHPVTTAPSTRVGFSVRLAIRHGSDQVRSQILAWEVASAPGHDLHAYL